MNDMNTQRPAQTREEKLTILRRNGYAPDRCAVLADESSAIINPELAAMWDGPGTHMGVVERQELAAERGEGDI